MVGRGSHGDMSTAFEAGGKRFITTGRLSNNYFFGPRQFQVPRLDDRKGYEKKMGNFKTYVSHLRGTTAQGDIGSRTGTIRGLGPLTASVG